MGHKILLTTTILLLSLINVFPRTQAGIEILDTDGNPLVVGTEILDTQMESWQPITKIKMGHKIEGFGSYKIVYCFATPVHTSDQQAQAKRVEIVNSLMQLFLDVMV
ncbi:unnamed protein product [Amaranthus hypochondriacus]